MAVKVAVKVAVNVAVTIAVALAVIRKSAGIVTVNGQYR